MGERRAHRVCRRIVDALLVVTLAPRCAACERVLESALAGPVCPACWADVTLLLPPFCRTCGDPLPSWRIISAALECCARCRRMPGALDAARSAGRYEGSLREIIHAFKYQGRRGLAAPLATMMREAGAETLAGADAVVPVPLHPWRRMRRGFNQADDLARRIGLPVVPVLRRVRHTVAQTALTAAARRRNVRGSFAPARWLPRAACPRSIAGRILVLVDDVRTTGATLEACAVVLKGAGAREVRALTVAAAAVPGRQRR